MPYYIGDVIRDEGTLIARTPEKFREAGIEVRLESTVTAIDVTQGRVRLTNGELLPYDVLVLATGAESRLPAWPGFDLPGVFLLKNLADAIRIKAHLNRSACRKAVVIGAGFIGMEMCEALRERGMETTVIHRGERPVARWDAEFAREIVAALERNGVAFLADTALHGIEAGTSCPLKVMTSRGPIEADLVLVAVGIAPNVLLARDMGLRIGATGAIGVDAQQRTSAPNVYAVGDCCEVYHRVSSRWAYLPLGDTANKQGRLAGRIIGGRPAAHPGVVGAQSFKIFELETAATGLNEAEALQAGFDPIGDVYWGNAIAGYFGKRKLGLKLLADRASGKLLGAQAIGETGAVGRINTLSAALWSELTLDEIGWLDLAYAPPFGGAWDVIHRAAQRLQRKR
ncbi:MAG TPA: FAD-dependent oxidoreductase [Syntrophales bacterium]|nr:FAD-dependent oxidoreductase [Syntrophales bacterium]